MDAEFDQPQQISHPEWLLWGFALFFLFFHIGSSPLSGAEARIAETVREMIVNNDYLHPALNGQVSFDKPLLGYWLILPFVWLLGETCEAAVRLPAALATLAALYGTLKLAEQLFDRRTALLSGWLLIGCCGTLFWGRIGTFDMINMAVTVMAVTLFLEVEDQAGFPEYLIFWLLGFAGALIKGVAAVTVPLVLLLPWVLVSGRWKKFLNWSMLFAFLTGATIYFLSFHWPTLIGLKGTLSPAAESGSQATWQLVLYGNFWRKLNAFEWREFIEFPRFLLPWSLLVILTIGGMLRRWRELPERFRQLLWGIALVLLLLGLFTVRRWHCVMPVVPFLVVMASGALLHEEECGSAQWNFWAIRLTSYAAMVVSALFIAFPVSLPLWVKSGEKIPGYEVVALLVLAGVVGWVIMLFDRRRNNPFARWCGLPLELASPVLAGTILTAVIMSVVVPAWAHSRSAKPFYLELNHRLTAASPEALFFFNTAVPVDFLYYTNQRDPVPSGAKFDHLIEEFGGQRAAIFCRNTPEALRALEAEAQRSGLKFNISRPKFREVRSGWKFRYKKPNYLVYLADIPDRLIEE